jgi:GNAT superfamily N-acetyltransferase
MCSNSSIYNLAFRLATKQDLPSIVHLLQDDFLGRQRQISFHDSKEKYEQAFNSISNNPMHELTIVELDSKVIGTFQLTILQYLNHSANKQMQVEAVRVSSEFRGLGIGTKVFEYIFQRARDLDCKLVQLTSDKKRKDEGTLRFYEKLGFVATHEGFKMMIE